MESFDGRGEAIPHGSHALCDQRLLLARRPDACVGELGQDGTRVESCDGRGEELPQRSHGVCDQRLLLPRRPDACVGELGQD
eukprot:1739853-Rhodomonas_salina.1